MKITRKIFLCTIVCLMIILIKTTVNATKITISPSNPKVGDKITVTVKVPNVHTASVTANVSGVVSGTIKVVGGDIAGSAKTYSNSASFKCKKEGKVNVNISSDSTAVLNGKYVDVGASKSINVLKKNTSSNTTTDDTTNSSDATLSNLGIKPNDFNGFRKANTSYSVSVPKNVDKISIYATPSNSKATVTGTGSKSLQIGKNTFNIKVTAEDKKTTKTYTLTITRKSEEENSSNAILKNLGIRPKEYDFTGFKPTLTTYNVSVPNDVEKITIYATAQNTNDTISGIGTKSLKLGQNRCEVKVTSGDKKNTKTYVINVTRKEEKDEEETDEKEENNETPTVAGIKEIKIDGANLTPSFSQSVYSYNVDVPSGTKKLDIETETTSEDIEVEVAGNENLKEGENVITLLVHNKKNDATATYQINAKVENQKIDLSTVNSELKDAESNAKKQEWIIKGTIIAIVVLIIIYLIQRYKITREQDDDEYEDDEYEQNYEEYEEDNDEPQNYESEDNQYDEETPKYTSTASEEIRKIGLFDTQRIEFEDNKEPKKHGRYKGRRFK